MEKRHRLDQLGRTVTFDFPPLRIISLVPSQTELLVDLGLADRVVGITRFCVHPKAWCEHVPKIGGTKKFDFRIIDELRPDLIIGNKEENYEVGINKLSEKYPVWLSDIADWKSSLQMIRDLGDLTGERQRANGLIAKIQQAFENLKAFPRRRVIYLIWKNPWMVAGQNTFVNTMLSKVGLENCVSTERYPELTVDEITKLEPEIILLSSEPYPFRERHRQELQSALPDARIIFVDGEMFSWYGSRLLRAANYFASMSQLIE